MTNHLHSLKVKAWDWKEINDWTMYIDSFLFIL